MNIKVSAKVAGRRRSSWKWLVAVVAGGLVAAVVVLGVTLSLWLRRSFPEQTGTVAIEGIRDDVAVYRDTRGVVHVYAKSRADLLFAQGFVHGQDRFWQMELARRAAAGRLSEVFGVAALDSDRFGRKVGFHRIAEALLAYYRSELPELVADLEAYAAGVNAYLARSDGHTAFQHSMVGLQRSWPIEPWSAQDTVLFGTYMASMFEMSWGNDYSNSGVAAATDEALRSLLLPAYPPDRPAIVGQSRKMDAETLDPRVAAVFSQSRRAKTDGVGRAPSNTPLPPGSNSWVISGKHTASGKPLLANDPHLQATLPTNFHEMGLHAPGFDVVGFSLPGGPGILIGRNAHVSWGLTNAVLDTQEAYIERLNTENPLEYEVNGTWRPVEVRREIIKVAGEPDSVLEVRSTRHGPIMQTVGDDATHVVALQWQGQRKPFRLFKAILDLNVAKNYDQFRQALSNWEAPALNFVYADDAGNIAYQLVGNLPIRKASRFAVPGWTDEHEWVGWVPFEELPAALNPEQGYIVTANNLITSSGFAPQFITEPGDRAERITDLLQQKIASGEKLTLDGFRQMQLDYHSGLAALYAPLVAAEARRYPELSKIAVGLEAWDGALSPDSAEAGLMSVFLTRLSRRVFEDELKDQYAAHASDHSLAVLLSLELLAKDPEHAWWDDASTPEREARDQIIAPALEDALHWLNERAGSRLEDWQWGKLHTVTFRSLPLGISGVAPLERLVNRGPYPVGGDVTTINAHTWVFTDVAQTFFYPALRFIADMGADGSNLGMGSIGQSSHPGHANYDDLIEPWLKGQSFPMPLHPADLERQARLTLTPAGAARSDGE